MLARMLEELLPPIFNHYVQIEDLSSAYEARTTCSTFMAPRGLEKVGSISFGPFDGYVWYLGWVQTISRVTADTTYCKSYHWSVEQRLNLSELFDTCIVEAFCKLHLEPFRLHRELDIARLPIAIQDRYVRLLSANRAQRGIVTELVWNAVEDAQLLHPNPDSEFLNQATQSLLKAILGLERWDPRLLQPLFGSEDRRELLTHMAIVTA